jgi:hypothetical protein
MPVLIAAVVIVGLLCVADLLLTFGVIRRLREHTEVLRARQFLDSGTVINLPAGQVPEPFTAVAADGAVIAGPAGLRLAGFFSATCPACPGSVAPFIEYVKANQIARDDALATLLVAANAAPPPYLGLLAEVARVTVQQEDGQVIRSFGVAGYPAFCLLDADGTVLASGFNPESLPATAMA